MRIAAVSALAALRGGAAADVMRPFITKGDPALAIVAAAALAGSARADDVELAEETLRRYSSDPREQGAEWRLQVARALGDVKNPAFRPLLVPLMYDANLDVAQSGDRKRRHARRRRFPVRAAAGVVAAQPAPQGRGARGAGRIRRGGDRAAGVFHARREEDIWIRRHVPSTLALAAVPVVGRRAHRGARRSDDGFLRFKATMALRPAAREHDPALAIDPKMVTRHINAEAARAFSALTLHYNLFVAGGLDHGQPAGARADRETCARA